MIFEPYKAIDIPIDRKRISNRNDSLDHFWEKVNKMQDDLSEAAGCYIFSIRAGGGSRPWYVGLAAKQTFRKECFTDHKVVIYNEILHKKKGSPTLTLIQKKTKKGNFVKPSKNGHKDIEFLENMLIGNCIIRNPDLLNIRKTRFLREMIVPGLLNTPKGRLYSSVKDFKKLIGE